MIGSWLNYGSWFIFKVNLPKTTEMQMYPTNQFNVAGGRIYVLLPKKN